MKCSLCPADATGPFSIEYDFPLCDACRAASHAALSRIAKLHRDIRVDEREGLGLARETALQLKPGEWSGDHLRPT